MTNRELARTARTFAYETNYSVQSATRDEVTQAVNLHDTSINHVRGRVAKAPWKREIGHEQSGGSRSKQFRFDMKAPNSRRERCSRCGSWAHWDRLCPALKLKCYICGKIGHFSTVCRQKRINAVQESQLVHDGKASANAGTKTEEVE